MLQNNSVCASKLYPYVNPCSVRHSDAFSVLDKSPFKEMRKTKKSTKVPLLAQLRTFLKDYPSAQTPSGNGWGLQDCTEA